MLFNEFLLNFIPSEDFYFSKLFSKSNYLVSRADVYREKNKLLKRRYDFSKKVSFYHFLW